MTTFSELVSPKQTAAGEYAVDVPDGWQQGVGAFGGLVLGMLARAASDFEPVPDRPFRLLTGQVLAPVMPGPTQIKAKLSRRGSGLSAVGTELFQQGNLLARADVVFAKARVSDGDWNELKAPELPAWESVEVAPVQPPFGPVFAPHFEYRPVGAMPFSGGTRAEASGWIRCKEPGPFGVPLVIGLADAYWPAPFARFTGPRAMSTVAFTLQLFVDPATLDSSEPLMYRATSPVSAGGYALELRELWTADGRCVAQNQQTFVMIK